MKYFSSPLLRKHVIVKKTSQYKNVEEQHPEQYWDLSIEQLFSLLHTNETGLSKQEAQKRLLTYGLNILKAKRSSSFHIFTRQITTNPLIIILALATLISYFLGQHTSAYYIFAMIALSIILGFWNEFSAERTIEKLLKQIASNTLIERDGEKMEIPVSELTIGDLVYLSTGTIIPADLRIITAKDLEINESALTGESKPVHKTEQILTESPQGISQIRNIAFMGTSVENGSGKGVVVRLAQDTEYGKIAKSISFIKPSTEFEKGLSGFGQLIVKVILILAICIFVVNALLGHKLLDSLLFSLAIAVGLTPELLPIIVTVSLSHGAGKLAKKHVVAKQLISLENLGNMDILCTDKTGTLTEGKIKVVDYQNIENKKDSSILEYALICNSAVMHHKLIGNGIDIAICEQGVKEKIQLPHEGEKIDEEPFDFNRKAMYTVYGQKNHYEFIVKGAPDSVLSHTTNIQDIQGLQNKFTTLNQDGLRVVAVAKKVIEKKGTYSWEDMHDLEYVGYISFLDMPKQSSKAALEQLAQLNVGVKILTGDNEIVTQKICKEVGMSITRIIIGNEIDTMAEEDFCKAVIETNVFAKVNPQQKLRVIQTLQKMGHTVGFMGDGINDIPSLHAADVGISVNTAVDVAKSSAAIVLLRNGLDIITEGIIEGRRTFNNTIKYILMGTSSNFGNMFSAAGASFFLPFLPMTPAQILLTNGLYDISQLSIPTDNVDQASLIKPRHWNITFIRNYMIFFGPISSVYDYITFGVMLFFFHASGALFQTGWFIESIATEILVVFVIRTAIKPFFRSRPSKWLTITCLTLAGIGIVLPFTYFGRLLGLVVPPPTYFLFLIVIVITYLFLVEFLKSLFLKRYSL